MEDCSANRSKRNSEKADVSDALVEDSETVLSQHGELRCGAGRERRARCQRPIP